MTTKDLHILSETIAGLAGLGERPAEFEDGEKFRAPLDDENGVWLAYNVDAERWVLSADASLSTASEDDAAEAAERLLRMSFDSRYTTASIGAIDSEGRLCCAVVLQQLPGEATEVERLVERLRNAVDGFGDGHERTNPAHVAAEPQAFASNWIRA